jgi:AraC-like DNA-binding protein
MPNNDAAKSIEYAVPAVALTGFCELVRDLGGEPLALLAAHGISQRIIDDLDEPLSLRAVANLLEASATQLHCPDFGMCLAERQDGPMITRQLDRAILNAPTYRDAVACTALHAQAYSASIRASVMWLPDQEVYAQRSIFPNDEFAMMSQLVELIVLLTQNSVRQLTAGHARAHEIWFSHNPVAPQPVYRARFSASVKFGQEFHALLFRPDAFDARLVDGDREVYRSELSTIQARFPTQPFSIEIQVREAIRALLAGGACSRDDVARRLGLSVRAMNRKLGEHDKCFETVRDEVRRNLAIRYLMSTDLPATEIASKLGYSELAVLSRSCQRWFASTPSALRRLAIPQMVAQPRVRHQERRNIDGEIFLT